MSSRPRVSVIVPHFRDLAGLDRCLASLSRQTVSASGIEIIVADNASPEGEVAVANVIAGRAQLVTVHDRGAGPARNGGVAVSGGILLAFIDSDCQAEPEWLEAGISALSDFDFVGGRVRVLVEDMNHMTAAEAFERVFAFDFANYILRKGFTGTGNLFCPRSLFDDVGGFRTQVSEDVEWSHRARVSGYRLGYAPAAIVGHPARRDWPALREKWRKTSVETYGLKRTTPWGRMRWMLRAVVLPISAVVHTPKVLASRELVTFGQRLAALSMLYRVRLWRMIEAFRLVMADREA